MRRVSVLVAAIATVAVLYALVSFADGRRHLYDLTTNDALTLTAQTRAVVARVRSRVDITVFLGQDDPGRAEAAALLERYRKLNRRVHYRVTDPSDAPSLVRTLEVDPTVDVLAAARGSFVARAPTVTEQDVTSVLAQVERRVSATLCFAVGHGEADPGSEEPEGLAAATRLLESNGYKTKTVDLLTSPAIPEGCAGLVLAAPTAELGDGAAAIASYLRSAGRLLVMSDPVSTVDLSGLLARYQLSFDRGIAFDADADAHLPDDVATLIVRSYAASNPVVRGLAPTLFPGAEAVVTGTKEVGGLATTSLAETGGTSYLDRDLSRVGFTRSVDRAGPITLVAAADRTRVAGPNTIERSRVVAAGDVDFATNAFIAEGGNARLLVQSVDWLTTQEDLVPLNANLPAYRPLALTRARAASARVLSVGIIPGAFLLAGLIVWVVRRRA